MDPNDPNAAPTPAADVAPAPVVAEAAPAVVEQAPAAVVEPAPVAAPVVEAAPAPLVEPSLLEKFDAEKAPAEKPAEKPAEAKPAEAKPAEVKPAEAVVEGDKAPVVEPPALDPIEYKYELPPTLKMDDALKGEVHTAFDDFRRDPAAGAQKLIDLHAKTMQDYADQVHAEQVRAWNETTADWARQAMADEQIGGSGHNTAMGAIARMRDMFVPEADRQSFGEFLKITGAGSHPAFLRMMHNAARFYDEPAMPSQAPKPPPNNGRAPGNRRGLLYDHPSSQSRNS